MRSVAIVVLSCLSLAHAAEEATKSSADHCLVLQDSETVTLKAALDVMAKVGVSETQAKPLLEAVSEKGEAVVGVAAS